MAVTENSYTGNGSTTNYSFTFPYLKSTDVEVQVDAAVTTAWSFANATTVQFNTAPSNGAKIKILRNTNVDSLAATFYAGSAIKSEDLNDNYTQNLYKTQEVGNRFFSTTGGTMTGDLTLGEDVELIFEGATDDAHETKLTVADPTADRTITFPDTTGTVVTTGDTGTVSAGMLAADAINGTKIANDSINSEHYVDGSIDTQHIADSQITTAKIADNNVTTAKIVDANITTAKLAADSVNGTKIADDSINSEHYVDGSIDTAHIADAQITTSKIVDDAVTADKLANTSVTAGTYSAADITVDAQGRVTAASSGAIATSEITDSAISTAKLANDSVTTVKIADNNVTTAKIPDSGITTAKIANTNVTDAKLASNAVTTSKITDANVTTDKIANDAITIGKIGCEQTTLSDSDSHIPTSGAVIDYVTAQISPLGGLEVIATEVAFPNTQPASGVVISISDAGGVVVNGSGVSTTGRTVGGSTITINGFPSSLQSSTLAAGIGLMVSSTGSSQTYNYHKILGKEDDIKQLSDDINDFQNRYRVGSSNPTSNNDAGDLFFNTGSSKLLVYNATNSAWEEAQSIGNFFISTFSEAFDGSRTQFTLSNAPANVQQIILSLNGVVQKPGTAFTLSGSTVTLASAPASGTDYFAVVMGSTVNIGTPSDGTVSTAKIASGAVTTAKIADGAVTEAKLGVSNSPTNGYFLSAQSGNTGGLTWAQVTTDLVGDTSPQLGGDLDTNSHHILLDDDHGVKFGDSADLQIYHDSSTPQNIINSFTSNPLTIMSNGDTSIKSNNAENMGVFKKNGAVELYYDNTKRFETTSTGVTITGGHTGTIISGDFTLDNQSQAGRDVVFDQSADRFQFKDNLRASFGDDHDLFIYHDGNQSYIYEAGTGDLNLQTNGTKIKLGKDNGETSANFIPDGAVELYHDNSKKLETTSAGIDVTGRVTTDELTVKKASGNLGVLVEADNGLGTMEIGGSTGAFIDLKTPISDDFDLRVNADGTLTSQGNIQLVVQGNENGLRVLQNGAVEAYHDNSKKFSTQSFGADIYGQLQIQGHCTPSGNNSYDLGTTSERWRNVYTNDLNLSNEGSSNDVDGTWGDWTIQEGESDLFLKNNRSGKKYKFNLTEVS